MRPRRDGEQRADRVVLVRLRRGEHVRGQHPLGEVVAPLELRVPPGGRDLAGEEQVLQHPLGGGPVPAPLRPVPGRVALDAGVHLARGQRAVGGDHRQHLPDQRRVPQRHLADRAPRVLLVRPPPPAQQRVRLRGHVRRLVRPGLDQPARGAARGAVQQRGVVRADPGERRHQVGARDDVHRVDLQQPDAVDHLLQVAQRGRAGALGAGAVEALGAQRDPARLRQRQAPGRAVRGPGPAGGRGDVLRGHRPIVPPATDTGPPAPGTTAPADRRVVGGRGARAAGPQRWAAAPAGAAPPVGVVGTPPVLVTAASSLMTP